MEKYNKKTIIMLIISIFFVVFFQTVVYSAFSSSFNVELLSFFNISSPVFCQFFKENFINLTIEIQFPHKYCILQ